MKKIGLILVILFNFLRIFSQSSVSIINSPDVKNLSGFESLCNIELNQACADLLTSMNLPVNTSFNIAIYHSYPISAYFNELEALEMSEIAAMEYLDNKYSNHLSFIVSHGPTIKVKIVNKIDDNLLVGNCKNDFPILANQYTKELNEKNLSGASLYCSIKEIINKYSSAIDSECSNLGEEVSEQWFIDNDFQIFDVTGLFELKVGNGNLKEEKKNTLRGSCPFVEDFSSLYAKNNSGNWEAIPSFFLGKTDYLDYPAHFVISDAFYSIGNGRKLALQAFNEKRCDLAFWIHVPKIHNGLQKIYIKTKLFKFTQGDFETHSIESLQNKFTLSDPIFNGVEKWDFKFLNKENEILNDIVSKNLLIQGSKDWAAGFFAGFADGFLADIKFLSSIIGYSINLSGNLTGSGIFSNLTFKVLIQQQSIKDALIGQGAQSYATFHDFYKIGKAFLSFLLNPGDAIGVFIEVIGRIIGESIAKLVFAKGSFQSGYTAGQAVYLGLGVTLIVKSIKIVKVLASSPKNLILKAADDIVKTVDKSKVEDLVKKAGIERIGNLAKYAEISKWYPSMPAWLKIRIASQSDDFLKFFDDMIKNYPKIKEEMVTLPKLFDYTESLHKDWWAKLPLRRNSYSGLLPAEYTKFIDDIHFDHNGIMKHLGSLGPAPLGTIFDEIMETAVRNGWTSGNFPNLSADVASRLQALKAEGYELLIKPKVSINGKIPEPDLLFIRRKANGQLDLNDAIYIDNKYVTEAPFTGAQREIVNNIIPPNGVEVILSQEWEIVGNINKIKSGTKINIKKVEIFGTTIDELKLVKKNIVPHQINILCTE